MGLTSKESLAASSKFTMNLVSEIPETSSELDEMNDKILLGKPIPARKREPREEVIRREIAAGERYFSELKASFPQTSIEELKLLRANLTISLILNKLMRDFNDPINGIPIELLENVKNQTVKLRQEINTELVNRGVTSL